MKIRRVKSVFLATAGVATLAVVLSHSRAIQADTIPLTMLDSNLQAQAVVTAGIAQPIGIVFLAANDYLVLEKASGQVKRVINGTVQASPVLDLGGTWNSGAAFVEPVLD